jgi:hypothetical protein
MSHGATVFLLTFGLFLGMLLCLEIGRHIGIRRLKDDSVTAAEGIGAADGAVFAVLGLLIAFTFSGATARFDSRRQLIVEETNDIGTAYRRLDLLRSDAQPALRESFRRYLDARPRVSGQGQRIAGTHLASGGCGHSDGRGAACGDPLAAPRAERDDRYHDDPNHGDADASADSCLRDAVRPGAGGFLAGGLWHDRKQDAQSIHMLGFALVMAVAVFVILDIEYPRLGLVRVDAFDQALVDLRERMDRDVQSSGQR